MVQINMEYIKVQIIQIAQRLFQIYNILIDTKLVVINMFSGNGGEHRAFGFGLGRGIGFAGSLIPGLFFICQINK